MSIADIAVWDMLRRHRDNGQTESPSATMEFSDAIKRMRAFRPYSMKMLDFLRLTSVICKEATHLKFDEVVLVYTNIRSRAQAILDEIEPEASADPPPKPAHFHRLKSELLLLSAYPAAEGQEKGELFRLYDAMLRSVNAAYKLESDYVLGVK